MNTIEIDYCIIGGSPVGLTLALLLGVTISKKENCTFRHNLTSLLYANRKANEIS